MKLPAPIDNTVACFLRFASLFRRDRKASVAVIIALSIVPLILMTGMAIDIGRSINVRAQLQRAADSAALAGASAYTASSTTAAATAAAKEYMDAATGNIKDFATVAYTVTLSTTTSSSTVSVYKVNVAATAKLKTTIMSIVQSLVSVGVSATADNPVYTVTISLSSFSSSAADGDIIYYYIVPADNGTPTSLTKMYDNEASNNSGSVTVTLTAGQKIGFALKNVTGDQSNYGSNSYGGAYRSTHYFYSHTAPPSLVAYPSVPQNHSLQVVTSLSAVTQGTQSSSPSLGAFSCATAGTTPYYFAWNDMGGSGSDDGDYNDAVYKVGCTKASSSAVNGVVLEQ